MSTDERNEAVIKMLIRHRDEWYTFVLDLIAELDTRQPEMALGMCNPDPPPTSATGELSRLNETP